MAATTRNQAKPQDRERERLHLGAVAAPHDGRVADRHERAELDRRDRDLREAVRHGERRDVVERGAAGVGRVRARAGAQRVAGAPPLGQEPDRRDQHRERDQLLAQVRVGEPQPEPVQPEEGPGLGAHQRGDHAEVERVVAAPVEVALERPQDDRRRASGRSCRARRRARTCCSTAARRTRTRRRSRRRRGRRSAGSPCGRPSRRRTGRPRARARATGRARRPGRRARTASVNRIGNGFQDGPPSVTRSRWRISRPQRIQAQGS